MAMPSGNGVVSDKMLGGGGDGVGEMVNHQRQWFIDERDGIISWLRGEFAAANAIIDALCNHLRLIGEPGEYDGVVGCIQQRRCNWSAVLHMQQYFSVAEVLYALQQVSWRRQQRYFEPAKVQGKEFRRGGAGGYKKQEQQRVEIVKEEYVNANDSENLVGLEKGEEIAKGEDKSVAFEEEKKDVVAKPQVESCVKSTGNSEVVIAGHSECEANHVDDACTSNLRDVVAKPQVERSVKSSGNSEVMIAGDSECEAKHVDDACTSNSRGSCNMHQQNDSQSIQSPHQKQNLTVIPKTFVGTEIFDGKTVNVVDGLKLYEELFDESVVSKIVVLVNDLRAAGRRGQLQGKFSNAFSLFGHGTCLCSFSF
ncbi:unnamed protein product [Ilex paraguariensis]|uniref:Uncharacterized protein n=2 Tax=Ilex paraguariensis TaxID=185542 RepID=A0ABC8RUL1_9AQUA